MRVSTCLSVHFCLSCTLSLFYILTYSDSSHFWVKYLSSITSIAGQCIILIQYESAAVGQSTWIKKVSRIQSRKYDGQADTKRKKNKHDHPRESPRAQSDGSTFRIRSKALQWCFSSCWLKENLNSVRTYIQLERSLRSWVSNHAPVVYHVNVIAEPCFRLEWMYLCSRAVFSDSPFRELKLQWIRTGSFVSYFRLHLVNDGVNFVSFVWCLKY